ncbi:uncharacterized protein LOC113306442 [Papaver somniferum]|uniref:uncharacterized protein LOC113306442 n=1 Tax=Papaver somniferum TaxID=3469 RepID=UPI000E6F9677|nr:uncharacterized protein LOC113306442 [Papaver somniferum]
MAHYIWRWCSADPEKIACMTKWPVPATLKDLRGFLGLTGYYRKFVKDYGLICKPLTELLKKKKFQWNDSAQAAFQQLKEVVTTTPVLALLDFTKPFELATYACDMSAGAALMQNRRPIAFFSKGMGIRFLDLSTYEKEMMVIVLAVSKWRTYLLGAKFTIYTDHQSIKYFMDQKVHSVLQQKWLSKLLDYTYELKYRKGAENLVTDALSRVDTTAYCQQSRVRGLYLLVWNFEGHSGGQATYQRAKLYFYWVEMKQQILTWVRECDICQQHKNFNTLPAGLLQPLTIPNQAWEHICMDFVTGLPKSEGREVILVVVDMFSKDSVFISNFWKVLFAKVGTSLHLSTSYHPQTDGQTERLTPFKALYGYAPPNFGILSSQAGIHAIVEDYLQQRQEMGHVLKEALESAQHRIKQQADKKRSERSFNVGDWVYLRLQPYRQTTAQLRRNLKLSAKFFGPYQVIAKVGAFAYQLKLPAGSRIHSTFHVSQLKPKFGVGVVAQTVLPATDSNGHLQMVPDKVIATREIIKNQLVISQVLVKWKCLTNSEATWEDKHLMKTHFPKLILEDKDPLE